MVEFTIITQVILWGLIVGSVYTLLATGLNVIFGVMKIVNFAHGELMILGAYITFWLWQNFNVDPYVAVVPSMISLMAVGLAVERLGFRPIKGTTKLNEIFLSLGLIYIFQNALAIAATPVKPVKTASPYEADIIRFGIVNLPYDFIITLSLTGIILVGLYLFLRKTKLGMSLRAVSQNRLGATLMGINAEKIDMISFGIGAALAALAGSLYGMLNAFDPYAGTVPAIKAFAIIILGSLGSIPGAIVGGFLYGVTESSATFVFGGAWRDATAFALLIVVLILKPEGLFGERE